MSDAYHFLELGEVDSCLECPPVIPDLFSHVWDWFLDLNSQRHDNAITWTDIYAYFKFKGVQPSSWDIEIIQKLDRQYVDIMS